MSALNQSSMVFGMPLSKLLEVAHYMRGISETAAHERAEVLKQTHGFISMREEGLIFEKALESSHRI